MLTQYNELKAARGKSFSLGVGNENSINYSGGNGGYGDYGGGDDPNSYYYGGGLSPAISMRSPSIYDNEVYGSGGSLKRKDRLNKADKDSDNQVGSGLLDIPDYLIGVQGSGTRGGFSGRSSHISDGKQPPLSNCVFEYFCFVYY